MQDGKPVNREAGKGSVGWNLDGTPPREGMTLAGLFRRQTAANPHSTALVSTAHHLTYRQLDDLSDRIALAVRHRYRESAGKEMAPGTPVGIYLDRSAEAVTAILGVLKAGAAYVPIDPEYPADRVAFIAESTKLSLVITIRHLLPVLSAVEGLTVATVLIDPYSPDIDEVDGDAPPETGDPGGAAYILHTSGSSGEPRGVECTHSNVIHMVRYMQSEYPLFPGDHCCLSSSLTFDESVYEIWSALLYGCALYVPDRHTALRARDLFRYIRKHRVASAYIPPYFVEELAGFVEEGEIRYLVKRLLFGAEPIEETLLARIKRELPGVSVINGYGPTEATICCSLYEVDGEMRRRRTPIGQPFGGTRLYVLDNEMQFVPVGTPGELYVSGPGLASGYIHRPDLTRQFFLENPFAEEGKQPLGLRDHRSKVDADEESNGPGGRSSSYSRIFRTEDIVILHQDRNLEFVGRKDRQVKIRGVRVDPAEVEVALNRHKQVRDCIAAVFNFDGEMKLAVYFISTKQGDAVPTPADLRAFLEESLPPHLVPPFFVRMYEFPRTSRGKIDVGALPTPGERDMVRTAAFVAPRTMEEETLAGIFREVLKLENIGIHDSFIDLGGHSLSATRVAARVQHVFGVRCPVDAVFDNPDVLRLSLYIKERLTGGGPPAPNRREELNPATIDLYPIDIDEDEALLQQYEALLSTGERERAAAFQFDRDRTRYVFMHGTLRRILSAYLDTAPGEIDFLKDEDGKPFVAGGPEFNISYSGERGLVAVAEVPVGVDIEKVNANIVKAEMIEEIFNETERDLLFGSRAPKITDNFFRGWVRKESAVKAIGAGVYFPLHLVESQLNLESFTVGYEGAEWWTCGLEVEGTGYRAALTTSYRGELPRIRFQNPSA